MFKLFSKKHTQNGLEVPDPTPIEIPLSTRPLTLAEQIARFTSSGELARAAQNNGMDTFDEADDFELPGADDIDHQSPYEEEFEGKELPLKRAQTRLDEQRSGMVEEMPFERQEKAQKTLRGLGKPKPAPQAPREEKGASAKNAEGMDNEPKND